MTRTREAIMIDALDATELTQAANDTAGRLPPCRPACALLLGSGWSDTVSRIDTRAVVDYEDVPFLGRTQVKGHPGLLSLAIVEGREVLIFQGRRHWYEGGGWSPVAFPVFLCAAMRVPILIITNAAGGIRPGLEPGNLMVIDDHINQMGSNPLLGARGEVPWTRFPDQTEVYDARLRAVFDTCAEESGIGLRHGTYVATAGPVYETPAEIAAFRSAGADAVGMSTVPEAMLAHAMGIRVAALSCISNLAAGAGCQPLSHAEVIEQTQRAQPAMAELLLRTCSVIARPS